MWALRRINFPDYLIKKPQAHPEAQLPLLDLNQRPSD